jgi:hypothetical protein
MSASESAGVWDARLENESVPLLADLTARVLGCASGYQSVNASVLDSERVLASVSASVSGWRSAASSDSCWGLVSATLLAQNWVVLKEQLLDVPLGPV